jgi:uracil-DNA glycosylase
MPAAAPPAFAGVPALTLPPGARPPPTLGGWQPLVDAWAQSDAGCRTLAAVDGRLASGATVFPPQPWRALALTPRAAVQVVILGQDPYHGPGQAEGLAFSVPPGQRLPPSLRNIWRELQRDLGLPAPASGSLAGWARQGVLLLNSSLTVESGQPASHASCGWQTLTASLVKALAAEAVPRVFMLWGAHAQAVGAEARAGGAAGHLWLCSNHPSPLSALRPPVPFIGCGHFSRALAHLRAAGRAGVDWGCTG